MWLPDQHVAVSFQHGRKPAYFPAFSEGCFSDLIHTLRTMLQHALKWPLLLFLQFLAILGAECIRLNEPGKYGTDLYFSLM